MASDLPVAVVGQHRHAVPYARRKIKAVYLVVTGIQDIRGRSFASFVTIGPMDPEHRAIVEELERIGVPRWDGSQPTGDRDAK